MSELKYIERELELLLDFQPNNEYSKSYLSPKDRIDKLLEKCSDEELFLKILDCLISELQQELDEYTYADLYAFEASYFEHYNWFFNDMMREINRKYNLLNKHQNIEKIPSIEEIPDIEKLQYRTKIILLNELGIIDFLKKRESFQSNTDLSKFITKIIVGKNEDEKSVYNTIRTDLSYLNQPNNNKSPYTESQKRIVNSILSTFSLPNIK
ncbi:MAG: hypothetical protein HN427_07435 [Flavobacteriales bacterium]|jgi:hypothetical protein|nr:hypothetical protein [Flavobacteriales bacterium]